MPTLQVVKERYTDALLNGYTREAYDIVKKALENQYSLIDIYTVIAEAMYSIGDLWETNEISIAQEHAATAITQFVLTQISAESIKDFQVEGKKAAVFSVESNTHYLGIQMIKNLLNVYQIQTFDFGSNVPNSDIHERIETLGVDLVAYSVTMPEHIDKAIELSETLQMLDPDTRPVVIVGGYAFHQDESLLEHVYYDYFFKTIHDLSRWLEKDKEFLKTRSS
ncbi:hypothetical protein GCM10012290_11800 [Halolactibacillus alkaliphilus]|uniref:B12-binding domain-containing protein n=1 Tax=Halolactibacillus alkaliphilus TaxID=442899 RepID=A0A511X0T8_9BACI|nr:B12-binding domain-containing protein [Halolactibacillus alkaliphilus]GEN56558.1 hypothetical protein HAL01_10220 [Halolactibacillus alkaliphilus]GGN69274.1 hypothetical protein GCM10012290_11800 [Halolactibacillus alkaliphilus]SFO75158.1 Methanogenic corrinoid protein MtbC1 [Halolactibacillus alkaliphilus]